MDTPYARLDELEAENKNLRKRSPPSDAEIEAWRTMWAKRIRVGLEMGEDDALLAEAVALMRRAQAAPASSALAVEAKNVLAILDGARQLCGRSVPADRVILDHDKAIERLRAALAAEPQAAPDLPGVVVPQWAREWAEKVREFGHAGATAITDDTRTAEWILSLPSAPPAAAVPAPDELLLLLEHLEKDPYGSVLWCETVERLLTLLARRAGAV